MTIHEMLNTQDRQILDLVQDYKIHLVAPAGIPDDDFIKFRQTSVLCFSSSNTRMIKINWTRQKTI